MLFDKETMFSDDQAVTTTASSTNVYDFGADGDDYANVGLRRAVIRCQVTETFAGGTSLQVQVRTGATTSPTTVVVSSAAIVTASLVAGYQFQISVPLPRQLLRYMDLNYVVVGTHTAGKITAGLMADAGQDSYDEV